MLVSRIIQHKKKYRPLLKTCHLPHKSLSHVKNCDFRQKLQFWGFLSGRVLLVICFRKHYDLQYLTSDAFSWIYTSSSKKHWIHNNHLFKNLNNFSL